MNQSDIDSSLKKMENAFQELKLSLSGKYDPQSDTISISCRAPEGPEVHRRHLDIYDSVFYYLPVTAKGKKYRFELVTFDETKATQHRILLVTYLDVMPDSGGISWTEWEAYTKQLTYTIDGVPQIIPAPPDFLEEEEESWKDRSV